MKKVRFIGLDVHANTIAAAVAEPGGEVRSLGEIANRPESIRKLVKKLGPVGSLRVCYEAGPTGYVIYWQLTALGVSCEVVAPTLVPTKAGDRVKTDRRDAEQLARCYRAGDLTAVWVPDAAHEALRDLVRAREAAKKDQLRARHRLGKFLLRHGRRPPTGMTSWTQRYLAWIKTAVQFEQPAQEATLLDYLHEVEHVAGRIEGLERAIDEAVRTVPARMRAVIDEAFEVAEYIGCHEETVRRAYLRGLLNSTRFGVRGRRFHPRDVLDWIRRGHQPEFRSQKGATT